MRKWLALLGLSVATLVFIGLNRLTADWHYIVPAEPGALLYVATFDGPPDDWDLYEGRLSAQQVDGVLVLQAGTANSMPFSATAFHFGDFDVRVQVRAEDGPLNNGFGLVFRLRDPRNYYMFLVSSDGYYRVVREVDGVQREISTWIPSLQVNQGLGALNHLRVVAVADTYHFFVNGVPAALCIPDDPDSFSTYNDVTGECLSGQMTSTFVDDSIDSGRLGVVVMTLNEPDVRVAFDNLVVYGPVDEADTAAGE